MNPQLPPERDLPAPALRQIEAALVSEVINGSPRRPRRWLVPAAAAVAVLVVLGVVVGALRFGDQDRVRPATPPSASPSPSPSPSPTRSVEQLTGNLESIVPGCVASYGLGGTPEEKARTRNAKLYNLLGTPSDGLALIYTEQLAIYCTVGGDVMAYNAGGGPVPSKKWIPSPYRIDFQSGGRNVGENGVTEVSEQMGGRISKDVARITLEAGDQTVEAHLENGTFVARLTYTSASSDVGRPTVRAYDAAGAELPDPDFPDCIKTPGGEVIDNGDLPGDRTNCAPAVAWP